MLSQAKTFLRFLRKYFNDYGGVDAVIGSPLMWLAIILTATSYRSWLHRDWPDTSIAIIPNLIGFSLGTYALLFSLISPRVKSALKALKNAKDIRYFDEMNATFFHFIFMQMIALVWALAYKQNLFVDIARAISIKFPCKIDMFP